MMLQHLCDADVLHFLRKVAAAGGRFALISTFQTDADFENSDIPCDSAGYRAQDLSKPPFSLGPPAAFYRERYPLDARVGLGLWPTSQLRRRLLPEQSR